jgi:hypothetical protein
VGSVIEKAVSGSLLSERVTNAWQNPQIGGIMVKNRMIMNSVPEQKGVNLLTFKILYLILYTPQCSCCSFIADANIVGPLLQS